MITKEAQEILNKFFNERKEVITQGGTNYIKRLYSEFIEAHPDYAFSLDSFRYRVQQYRQENTMRLAVSRGEFKEAKEAFIKLLDENRDLLTLTHWINEPIIKDFIGKTGIGKAGDMRTVANLRTWMHQYRKRLKRS